MKGKTLAGVAAGLLTLSPLGSSWAADDVIKLGFNLELSGGWEDVGASTKNSADLVRQELEKAGGLKIGDKTYKVEFLYGDNTFNKSKASSLALSQISQEEVIAIIGPQSSNDAIPAGEIANSFQTPLVSPWSTSPVTTLNRPFVFRACIMTDDQGPVLAKFVEKEFGATKAAVLFDVVSAYPRTMAKSIRDGFEDVHGPGSVVAFEEFRTGDKEFRTQLLKIKNSDAQVLFVPQHYHEVPLIVREAKQLGLTQPIVGANAWAGGDLMAVCGDDCKGLFFSGSFAPGGVTGKAKEFVDLYQQTYGKLPDEPGALAYDAVHIVLQALQNTGGLSGNILEDRVKLKEQLTVLKNFDGVTGKMSYNETGNPEKCVAIIKIGEDGVFNTYETVCP